MESSLTSKWQAKHASRARVEARQSCALSRHLQLGGNVLICNDSPLLADGVPSPVGESNHGTCTCTANARHYKCVLPLVSWAQEAALLSMWSEEPLRVQAAAYIAVRNSCLSRQVHLPAMHHTSRADSQRPLAAHLRSRQTICDAHYVAYLLFPTNAPLLVTCLGP